jgi:hypothetical protein
MTPAAADPDDVKTLRAALAAEREARIAAKARATGAEARAVGAEAMITHLKLVIAKLRHDKFGASSERGRKLLDHLELELVSWLPQRPRTRRGQRTYSLSIPLCTRFWTVLNFNRSDIAIMLGSGPINEPLVF